ncbi:MAG: ANTAR domain-containing response regulator [Peptococcaceae bacterium]
MGTLIVLGIQNKELTKQIKSYLNHMGSTSIQEAKDGDNLLRLARKQFPQFIIYDPCTFGPNGIQISKIITREKVAPIIFIVSQPIYRQAVEDIISKEAYASTYLVPPFSEEQFRIALTTTTASYKKISELEQKIIKLNESLKEKKKVGQAKELLMNKKGMTEPEAHRFLQRKSMETGVPLKAIAQKILNEL